jgi:hypothetical protein
LAFAPGFGGRLACVADLRDLTARDDPVVFGLLRILLEVFCGLIVGSFVR